MKKFLITLLLLWPVLCLAQQQKEVTIHLNNGNSVRGEIVSDTPTAVTIKTVNGQDLTFNKVEIRKIDEGNTANRPMGKPTKYVDYSTKVQGFWCAAELGSGVNIHTANDYKSSFPTEFLFTGGYRFNQFIQVGAGIGVRYYIGGNDRTAVIGGNAKEDVKLAYPAFVNARGVIFDDLSRTTVPYWSVNVGYTINDGFYFSPSVGLRFGSTERNAFILSIGYALQGTHVLIDNTLNNNTLHAATLKIGYQF